MIIDFHTHVFPEKIAKAYGEMTADVERISPATRNLLGEMSEKGNTKGHFFRGVE